MVSIYLIYGCVGALVGVLAGLLGIGGGIIIVPMLVFAFGLQGVSPEITMHLALGTSLASIMFTSVSSFMAHHKRGAVHWQTVWRIVIGIFTGAFIGSCFASILSTEVLKAVFVIFLYAISIQMLTDKKPKAARELPGLVGMLTAGNVIGFVSSLVGIGGGSLSVPFMMWCNVVVHHAIGTSAAIGLPIAIAGTAGYVFNGWGTPNLPEHSVGFVYLPALLGIAVVSMLTAPIGVKLAHSLAVDKLKRIFSLLFIVVATKMLFDII